MSLPSAYAVESFPRFEEIIRASCGASVSWTAPRQVRYLKSYLGNYPLASAQTILVEPDYVDRHYLEEFTAYYGTTLRPPAAHATRMHFFRDSFDTVQFEERLERAARGELESVERELRSNYLGFVVIRPIPTAPIGRSLLKPYPEEDGRYYHGVIRQCSVHLFGLELTFDALPFEQQDQGVGACASVALWASLAKISRSAGTRAPTPFAVTSAATKNSLNDRILPASSGLDAGQMANAIREFGFAPYTVKVNDNPETFLWTLKVYLRSGIPAVLTLRAGTEVHAAVVAGHREGTTQLTSIGADAKTLQYRALERVYVHDDRIGPYVKMSLKPHQSEGGWRQVGLSRDPVDEVQDVELTRNSQIDLAVFPLYPKLRLSASDLSQIAASLGPLFRILLGVRAASNLRAEGTFYQNGAYLRDLFELEADAVRVGVFARSVRMSRYVAVIRWFLGDEMLADVICDTTDIFHETTPYAAVLGVFLIRGEQVEAARNVAGNLIDGSKFF